MRPPRIQPQGGFSLLELLVAFSIMAMSLGLLYQAIGNSTRSVTAVEQNQRAAELAQSILNLQDAVAETGWNEAGESGGFAWQVRSAPYATDISTAGESAAAPPLHEVAITIRWADRSQPKQLDLFSLLPQRKLLNGAPR